MRFHISLFDSVSDNGSSKSQIDSVQMMWDELCREISEPRILARKENGRLWNGAQFGNVRAGQSLRHVKNISENSLLFFDYDKEETFAEAIAYWSDMQCAFLAHTSFSHAPEQHKFRVIVPLAAPIPEAKYKLLWKLLATQGDEVIDLAPSSAASIFYVPAHREGAEYLYHIEEGNFLDWTTLNLAEPPPPKPKPIDYNPSKDKKRATAYLSRVVAGCVERVASAAAATGNITLRNRTMLLAGYLHYGVYTESDIESQMTGATRTWTKRKNIQSTVRRAIRDGAAKPIYLPASQKKQPARVNAPPHKPPPTAETETDWEQQVKDISDTMEGESFNARQQATEDGRDVVFEISDIVYWYSKTHLYATAPCKVDDPDNPGKKIIEICDFKLCTYLKILAKIEDQRTDTWHLQIEYLDQNGTARRRLLPMALLSDTGRDSRKELLSWGIGIEVGPKNRELLQKFLCQEVRETALLPAQMGWHGEAYIFPDEIIGEVGARKYFLPDRNQLNPLVHPRGTADEWRNMIGQYCVGNDILMFVVCAALVAPFLKERGLSGLGFHLVGATSEGKTTAVKVAGSVWGGKDDSLGFVRSWDATGNAMQCIAAFHNDAMLGLDEVHQADKTLGKLLYGLTLGTTRERMLRDANGLREQLKWSTVVMSTGEVSIAQIVEETGRHYGGQAVRVLDIPCNAGAGMGIFQNLHSFATPGQLAEHLNYYIRKHFGTIIRLFIKQIVQDGKTDWEARWAKAKEDLLKEPIMLNATPEVKRAADLFVLVQVAGEIASDILGWQASQIKQSVGFVLERWLENRGGAEIRHDDAYLLAQVRNFVLRHSSRFERIDETEQERLAREAHERNLEMGRAGYFSAKRETINRAGWTSGQGDEQVWYIIPGVFIEEVCAGFEYRLAAKKLTEEGRLNPPQGRNLAVKKKLPDGSSPRIYRVSNLFVESPMRDTEFPGEEFDA